MVIKNKLRENWDILLFIIVIAVVFLINYDFISKNNAPPYMDAPFHLMNANHYYNTISDKNEDMDGETESGEVSLEYPPLLYWTTLAVYKAFGFTIKSALSSTFLYSFIFLLSAFLTAKHLGGKLCGLLTLLVAASSHITLELTHSYLLEMPQAALVALSLFFLLKTHRFQNQLYSILFGAVFAMAMLAKQPAIFFILPAFILYSILWGIGKNYKLYLVLIIPGLIYSISGYLMIRHARSLGLSIEMNNPVPSYGIPLIIIISVLFYLFASIPDKLKLKMFSNCSNQSITAAFNALKALIIAAAGTGIYYIYAIKGVLFKMNVHSELASTAADKAGIPLFFISLVNYLFMLRHFGFIILILAVVGIIVMFAVKYEKRWEIVLLLSAGFAGLAGHALLAHASVYYIHFLIIPVSILAFHQLRLNRPTGIITTILVLIITVLSFLYPLTKGFAAWGGINPIIEKSLALSRNVIPDRANYHLNEVIYSIETERQKYPDQFGDNPAPVFAWESPGFRYAVTGPGEIDRQMFEVTREYMKLDDIFIYSFDSDWETPLNILKSHPVFIICGILNNEKEQTEKMIQSISGRRLNKISEYRLSADRIIYVFYLVPDSTTYNERDNSDFENTLRRMQRRPGEKEDMTGPAGGILKRR